MNEQVLGRAVKTSKVVLARRLLGRSVRQVK